MPSTVVDHSGSATDTDTGLFGPQSLTWRVHLEPVLFVGGLRALILQALHPWVMLGTYQNSALFDPAKAWARFLRTAEFVGIRTYGTTSEVERLRVGCGGCTRAPRTRPGLRSSIPARRPGLPAVGALWGDRLVRRRRGARRDPGRRRRGPLCRRERPGGRADRRRGGTPVAGRTGGVLRRGSPRLRLTDEAIGDDEPAHGAAACSVSVKLTQPPTAALAFATMPRWARRMYARPGAHDGPQRHACPQGAARRGGPAARPRTPADGARPSHGRGRHLPPDSNPRASRDKWTRVRQAGARVATKWRASRCRLPRRHATQDVTVVPARRGAAAPRANAASATNAVTAGAPPSARRIDRERGAARPRRWPPR